MARERLKWRIETVDCADRSASCLAGAGRDLGVAGRDDLFRPGHADVFAAVSAVAAPAVPASTHRLRPPRITLL
jgi:hypothetical protein